MSVHFSKRVHSSYGILKGVPDTSPHVKNCLEVNLVALVIYWCITNYPKLSSVIQLTFIISQVEWVRN